MRRFSLLLLALAVQSAFALPTSDKNTHTNTRYERRNPHEAKEKEFNESKVELPALPDQNAKWFEIYVAPDFTQKPKVDLDSIMFAPDGSIRYTLNVQSAGGLDNITAEGIYCSDSSFNAKKKTSFKVFGYGDTVNRRWIEPRNPKWQDIGSALNSDHPIRNALYRAFCEDGIPSSREILIERLTKRAGAHSDSLRRRK